MAVKNTIISDVRSIVLDQSLTSFYVLEEAKLMKPKAWCFIKGLHLASRYKEENCYVRNGNQGFV